jgi:AGZA family xanthine/uracil permease-like MFS transporter
MEFINKYFKLDKLGSNPKREFIAGLTTFFAMCYILFVNPSVLGASGMDKGAVFTATALGQRARLSYHGYFCQLPDRYCPVFGS